MRKKLEILTRFPQIESTLEKKRCEPKLAKILKELIWGNLFSQNWTQNVTLKRSFLALFNQSKIA